MAFEEAGTTPFLSGPFAGGGLGLFAGMAIGMILFLVFLMILVYVYQALTLMIIAKKLNHKHPWLAWIPIANIFLEASLAEKPWWTVLFILLAWVPFLGVAIIIFLMIWYFWRISERRGQEGWMGILMIVPIVQWIVLGILAWGKGGNANAKPAKK